MKKNRRKNRIYLMAACILFGSLILYAVWWIRGYCIEKNRSIAEKQLDSYEDMLQTKLLYELNYARDLANAISSDPADTEYFQTLGQSTVEQKDVRLALLFKGKTVFAACAPGGQGSDYLGMSLSDFPYALTMVNLNHEPAIECPIAIRDDGGEYFLFLQPVKSRGEYWGQVSVFVDKEYILEQLALEAVVQEGYAYEFWHINTNDGSKDIISVSHENYDFSKGVSSTFHLPGQWTLTVMPVEGWIMPDQELAILGFAAGIGILIFFLLLCLLKMSFYRDVLCRQSDVDSQSGLYNKTGFRRALSSETGDGKNPFALLYFVIDDFNRISQICRNEETDVFLRSIEMRVASFITSRHITGRFGECNFMVAVFEEMEEDRLADICRGLSIELIWKFNREDRKAFPNVGFEYARYPQDCADISEMADQLVHKFFTRVAAQSPVRSLTDKVQQLIRGDHQVVFEEYADTDMMNLSKTINQYRKKVEQLAYQDTVYAVGNRSRYLRDTRMMIAYDKKRKFTIYCFDICSFNKYNELFSVETGDRILRVFSQRLRTVFQDNLYRINGDVFLGILQGAEEIDETAENILNLLAGPIEFGAMRFVLDVKCGICIYPQHARTAEELLEYAQTAVHYSKEHDNGRYIIYNDELTEMLRFEEKILNSLELEMEQNTLEVWYQPIMNLSTGRFSSAEALLRLNNGEGGYHPTDKVIAIAEKYRIVDHIGDYVLQEACEFIREYGDELGLDYVSVNLSVQQLMTDNCVTRIKSRIEDCGVLPQRICMEITETFLIQSFDYVRNILLELSQTGIFIALDDFGAGYSSLNYLYRLPVDILKIDRLLTQQSVDSQKQLAILKKIVEIAELNDMLVVTEGIETKEELKIIKEAGMNYIQGYYFSKPIPRDSLIQLLRGKDQ